MHILITGALGHLGSALLDSPFLDNHQVTVVDNLSSNHHAVLFRQFLRNRIEFIQDDITSMDLDSVISGKDVVIHLAAITDAAHSHLHKEEVETVNFQGTAKVARACAKHRVKLLFPSSTSVYGQSNGVVDEDCKEVRPQSPYAWSKLNSENFITSSPNLEYVILRFGTIYGPSLGARFHTFCNMAALQAATRQPVTVWETALYQNRPYLDICDAVSAISHVVDKLLFPNRIFNVITNNHSVNDILVAIRRHRPDVQVKMVQSELMNQLSFTVSCEKFKATGWTPAGNLQEGIAQEMDWLSGIN